MAALLIPGLDDEESVQAEKGTDEVAAVDSDYIPSVDLEPRRKPTTIAPSSPCFIYELDEKDIHEDIEAITKAIKVGDMTWFNLPNAKMC